MGGRPDRATAPSEQRGGLDDGSNYYQHWLDTLEALVLSKQMGSSAQLHELEHAWEAAAARTPHGQPIELQPQDFSPPH